MVQANSIMMSSHRSLPHHTASRLTAPCRTIPQHTAIYRTTSHHISLHLTTSHYIPPRPHTRYILKQTGIVHEGDGAALSRLLYGIICPCLVLKMVLSIVIDYSLLMVSGIVPRTHTPPMPQTPSPPQLPSPHHPTLPPHTASPPHTTSPTPHLPTSPSHHLSISPSHRTIAPQVLGISASFWVLLLGLARLLFGCVSCSRHPVDDRTTLCTRSTPVPQYYPPPHHHHPSDPGAPTVRCEAF